LVNFTESLDGETTPAAPIQARSVSISYLFFAYVKVFSIAGTSESISLLLKFSENSKIGFEFLIPAIPRFELVPPISIPNT